jgi:hypothetical protein
MKKLLGLLGVVAPLAVASASTTPTLALVMIILLTNPVGSPLFPAALMVALAITAAPTAILNPLFFPAAGLA